MIIIDEAWHCDECCKWHDDEDDARECCPPSVTEGYKCAACKKYHFDAHAAECCCSVFYTCPNCEAQFPTIELAEDCCDCEINLERIPPAQLEQYGQQRLLP